MAKMMMSGWGQPVGAESRRMVVEELKEHIGAFENLVEAPTTAPPPSAKIVEEEAPVTTATVTPAAEPTPLPAKSPRRPKDPNAPKRPLGAFFLYAREVRPQVQAENPGMLIPEVNRILGQMWEKENRQLWEQKNAQLLQSYQQEMEMYKQKNTPAPAENSPASEGQAKVVSSDPTGNVETSQVKKRKRSKKDQPAEGAKAEERLTPSTPSNDFSAPAAQTTKETQINTGLEGRSRSPVAMESSGAGCLTGTVASATLQKKKRKPTVRVPSMSPLGGESNFLEDKSPSLTMSHCNTLSSSQLLFGLPSSSQQSTSGLDLSQSLTATAGVETTPDILKPKRKKKRSRPVEAVDRSNGHEVVAPISREN